MLRSGDVWSAGYQPSGVEPDSYEVEFTRGSRPNITRRDGAITTMLEVVVSPENDAEVRRVSISNARPSGRAKSRSPLMPNSCLAPRPPTRRIRPSRRCSSRPNIDAEARRSPGDAAAALAGGCRGLGGASRRRRRRDHRASRKSKPIAPVSSAAAASTRSPIAVMDGRPLSEHCRHRARSVFAFAAACGYQPGETVRIAFWTMVAPIARRGAGSGRQASRRQRLRARGHAGVDPGAGAAAPSREWMPTRRSLFQRLAGHVLYADPSLRPSSDIIRRGSGGPAGLWAQGISGDMPIVLVRIDDIEDIAIVAPIAARPRILADEATRRRSRDPERTGVLLRSGSAHAIETLVRTSQSRPLRRGADDARRRVRPARRPDFAGDARAAAGRGAGRAGRRAAEACRSSSTACARPALLRRRRRRRSTPRSSPRPLRAAPDLEFFNGLGGFAADGREYVTILAPGK